DQCAKCSCQAIYDQVIAVEVQVFPDLAKRVEMLILQSWIGRSGRFSSHERDSLSVSQSSSHHVGVLVVVANDRPVLQVQPPVECEELGSNRADIAGARTVASG